MLRFSDSVTCRKRYYNQSGGSLYIYNVMNAYITCKIHKIIGMLWMKAKAIPKESLRAQPDKIK